MGVSHVASLHEEGAEGGLGEAGSPEEARGGPQADAEEVVWPRKEGSRVKSHRGLEVARSRGGWRESLAHWLLC